jgi:hypothetical protein
MNPTPTIVTLCLALAALPLQDSGKREADASAIPQDSTFSQDRLEQLAAPIALYPDALLAQILIASTYPLEIVEAHRWIQTKPGLTGTALEEALKTEDWDPSVKSLCGFPTVLERMDADLDWTRDLGDAFLGQKAQLMDAIQLMRKKALDAGNLKSTEQQKVEKEDDHVVIQSASPDVIYVPTYSPVVVYGPGWYSPYGYYPYWYYPPPYGGGFVTFGIGFFWGSGCWSHCDWHHHTVFVDVVAYRSFHARTCSTPIPSRFLSPTAATAGSVAWTHDPRHRAGVAYRSPEVERSVAPESRAIRPEMRGDSARPIPPRAAPPSPKPARPMPPPATRPPTRPPAHPEGPLRDRPVPPGPRRQG